MIGAPVVPRCLVVVQDQLENVESSVVQLVDPFILHFLKPLGDVKMQMATNQLLGFLNRC